MGACLIVREPGQPDRLFHLTQKETIIGRSADAHLPLPHITVSREHGKFIRLGDTTFFETLSDQQSTLVNGEVRQHAELQTKDTVQIGKYTLVFFGPKLTPLEQFFEGKALDEYPPYARTSGSARRDATFQMTPSMVKRMMDSGKVLRNATLISEEDSRKIWTPGDKTLIIGKGAEVPIDGWFVSAQTAEIRWNGNDHVLRKIGGMAKILVNGSKLTGEHFLNDGDKIQIGKSSFSYEIKE